MRNFDPARQRCAPTILLSVESWPALPPAFNYPIAFGKKVQTAVGAGQFCVPPPGQAKQVPVFGGGSVVGLQISVTLPKPPATADISCRVNARIVSRFN